MARPLVVLLLTLGLLAGAPHAPEALEVSPAAWSCGDWIEVTISGAPLAEPDSAALLGPVRIEGADLRAEATGLVCRFDLRAAPMGWYDLRLATAEGEAHTEPQCFEARELALPVAWSIAERLTEEPEVSSYPDIATDIYGQAHLVWQNKQPAVEKYNIWFRTWDGSGWSEGELVNPGG